MDMGAITLRDYSNYIMIIADLNTRNEDAKLTRKMLTYRKHFHSGTKNDNAHIYIDCFIHFLLFSFFDFLYYKSNFHCSVFRFQLRPEFLSAIKTLNRDDIEKQYPM